MQRCPANLHFFNTNENKICPYCRKPNAKIDETVGLGGHNPPGTTRGPGDTKGPGSRPDGETIGLPAKTLGYDPVVGWLVCVDGESIGRDYRISSGSNSIGRDRRNRIQITGDLAISNDTHALITYDPRDARFYFERGSGRNPAYVNDEIVLVPRQLAPYDRVEIGETKLLFVPLCGESFQWAPKT